MAAQRINMNGSDDPFYRYTMPPVTIKVEGTTKMIKTVLTNIEDVASACGRPIDYLVTFFGQELNANSKIDTKTNKSYVTGNMKQADIQAACFKFIKNYVMCGTCNNPETVVTVSGKKKAMTVVLICKGCGAKTTLDNTDRFVKFQVQHPPALTKQEEKLMGDVLKKKKKSSKSKGGDGDEDEARGGDDSAEEEREEKKSSKKKESSAAAAEDGEDAGEDGGEKKKKKKKKKKVVEEEDDDEDWCMDTSEEAVKARREAMNVDKVLEAAEAAVAKPSKAGAASGDAEDDDAVGEVAKAVAAIQVADDEVEDIDDI